MSELAGVSATDVDGPIARVTKAIPLQGARRWFEGPQKNLGNVVLPRAFESLK